MHTRIYMFTNDANTDRFVGELHACWETAANWSGLSKNEIVISGAWHNPRYPNELSCVFRRERRRGNGTIAACGITITPNINRGDLTLVLDAPGSWSAKTDKVAAALVAIGERRRRTLEDLTTARRRNHTYIASIYGSLRAVSEAHERPGTTGDAGEYGGQFSDARPMAATRQFVLEGKLVLACAHAELAALARRGFVRSARYASTPLLLRARARTAIPCKTIPVS